MKKIFYSLFIVGFILTLVACGNRENGDNIGGDTLSSDTVKVESTDYAIIIRDPCSDEIKNAADKLMSAIEDKTDKTVKVLGDEEVVTNADVEILLGNTRREESKALSVIEQNYVIDYSGEKILIKGRSDSDTTDAVNYFIDNYISEGDLVLANGDRYEYTFTYPTLSADEIDLKGYSFINKAGIFSDVFGSINNQMNDTYGYYFYVLAATSENDKSIVVDVDESIGENRYKSYIDGTKIYLVGSDKTAAAVALSAFISKIPLEAEEGSTVEISISDEGKTMPSVLENQSGVHFEVSTDKDALSYSVGDEIVFDIKLVSESETVSAPLFAWTVKCEKGDTVSGFSGGGTGCITLKATMKDPGFAYVNVKACDENGVALENIPSCGAGACASVDEVTVSADEPDDWENFWEKQLERLNAVEPVASEMEDVSSRTGYYTYDIKVNCPGDESYTGETYSAIFVSVPKKAEAESLKISVKFMGAGVRSTETHLSYSEDAICVSVNGHSIPSYMGDDFYKRLESELGSYTMIKPESTDPSEVFYSYMVMRDLQALRFVKSYFGPEGEDLWDGKTVEVSGMSEGGYQALFTAALDPDVTLCVADVPAMCDKQGVFSGRMTSYGPTYSSMLYYDACFFARRIKCPVRVMVGLGDTVCCPSGITSMYNELNCDKQITYVQNMGHAYPTAGWNQQTFEFGNTAK